MLIGSGAIMWMQRQSGASTLRNLRSDLHKTSFDKDNPKILAKPANLRIVMALNLLSAMTTNDTFSLVSDDVLHQKLRHYRGWILDTTKLPTAELLALCQVIQLSNDSAAELPTLQDSFTALTDSGCSFTCTNNKRDFCQGTIVELPKPLTLGGIASGLQVQHQGSACWETVDDSGNVLPFQTKAYLCEPLQN